MKLLLIVSSLSVAGLWVLWWMTYRALQRTEQLAAERQLRIESQLKVIEQLLERLAVELDGMPHASTRRQARSEVQQLLDRQ